MRSAVIVLAVILTLTGCAASQAPTAEPSPSETSAAPTPEAAQAVDASAFASQVVAGGVDFDSADRNIHCGVWPDEAFPELSPYAGCAPDEWDFVFPTVPFVDATAPGNATIMQGTQPGEVVAHSDAPYAGQNFALTVGVLEPGQSIASSGITCTALDAAIRCVNDATGHGFTVSRAAYEVF